MEDWSGALPAKILSKETWKEKQAESSSSFSAPKVGAATRFSFNGTNRISFFQNKGSKADWELSLPPIENYKVWNTGAWSGLSLSAKELHHFYTRGHRRGLEPKYRVYSLSPEWEVIDFIFCSLKDSFILEKSLKAKKDEKMAYQLIQVKMLSSQELKREVAWEFEADAGQEFISLKAVNCTSLELEGWPKSYVINLK